MCFTLVPVMCISALENIPKDNALLHYYGNTFNICIVDMYITVLSNT
jgi:hypothetical protein